MTPELIDYLVHRGPMTHICVGKLTIIGFRSRLVAWTAPNHYLNLCFNIVNWTLANKFQWNLNRNSNNFIQWNTFQIVVCEMASILSRPQPARSTLSGDADPVHWPIKASPCHNELNNNTPTRSYEPQIPQHHCMESICVCVFCIDKNWIAFR